MSSITFKAVIIPGSRRRDGTYPVKIRVTFKGKSRRLATNLVARSSDVTSSERLKSPDIINRANVLIEEMRATISGLSSFVTDGWNIDRVVEHISTELAARNFRLDLFRYADKYLAGKEESTRRAYDSALRSLERYIGRRELDVNDITKVLLLGWRSSIEKGNKMQYRAGVWRETSKPQGGGQATRHLDKVAHIFRMAQLEYNDDEHLLIPRNPFAGIPKILPPAHGQKNLGSEMIQKIIDSDCDGLERVALDIFLVSFGLMGANLADLYEARNISPMWTYNRRKTRNRRFDGAEMRVVIPPELSRILSRLGAQPVGAWLPSLLRLGTTTDRCTARVNYWLRRWAIRNGIEPFTFYAARHSWASIARKLGIEKATIDECLCHVGDYRMTDIYAERDFDLMNAANRKVIESFRWP